MGKRAVRVTGGINLCNEGMTNSLSKRAVRVTGGINFCNEGTTISLSKRAVQVTGGQITAMKEGLSVRVSAGVELPGDKSLQ